MTAFGMIQSGIINPHILHLLARVRHTNLLVIGDWAFPHFPEVETVDISLTRGIPTVLDLIELLKPNFKICRIVQAEEFLIDNTAETIATFDHCFSDYPHAEVQRIPHDVLKAMVPSAIGIIRTGDTTKYANLILESV